MKQNLSSTILAVGIGVALGWFARDNGDVVSEETLDPVGDEARPSGSTRSRRGSDSTVLMQSNRWMPKDEGAFLNPESASERAEVRRLVRRAIEKEPNFHTRMKAVADLLALMTPENAQDIRDAFVNSRKEGYWYALERKVFLARYGEIMGEDAVTEFKDDPDFVRALESWALVAPTDAVDWVNDLGPGSKQDDAINRLIGAFGSTNLDYAIEVFDALTERDQSKHQRALTEAAIRAGGRDEGTRLATDLLGRESEALQKAGRQTLQHVFDLYGETDERLKWLRSLSSDVLDQLDPSKLPREFQSSSSGSEDR